MRPLLALAAALAVLADAAWAQAPASPAATAPSPAPAPASAAAKADPGKTVSGVTVEALPRKQCAPKDKDCIALVMAQVKELYPEQLKKFCFTQQMDVMRQDMQANLAGWCDSPGLGATSTCSHHVSPVVKQVCAPDKKPDKK